MILLFIKMLFIIIGIPIICVLLLKYFGTLLQTSFLEKWGMSTGRLLLAPGVIVHELSHALFALLFFIPITDMKLYIADPNSSTLGYVQTAINTLSFRHRLGAAFIGIAPLIGNTALIVLIYYKLFTQKANIIFNNIIQVFHNNHDAIFSIANQLFNPLSYNIFKLIIFIVLMVILLSGFSLSNADLQVSATGLIDIIILASIISIISIMFVPLQHIMILINSSLLIVTLFLILFLSLGTWIIKLF